MKLGLSLKFMWAGSHYQYNIICQPQKRFGSWTLEATLHAHTHLGLSASTFRGVIAVLQYAQNRQVKQQSTKSITYTTAVRMVRKAGPKKACKYRMGK